jgi:hypothetical protein
MGEPPPGAGVALMRYAHLGGSPQVCKYPRPHPLIACLHDSVLAEDGPEVTWPGPAAHPIQVNVIWSLAVVGHDHVRPRFRQDALPVLVASFVRQTELQSALEVVPVASAVK